MNRFGKTEKRQLLDALSKESESKKFKVAFKESWDISKGMEGAILSKRKSYEFMIVNMLKDFGVSTEGIYEEFDKAWDYGRLFLPGGNPGQDALDWFLWIKNGVLNPYTWRQDYMQKAWNYYQEAILGVVEDRCDAELKNQRKKSRT